MEPPGSALRGCRLPQSGPKGVGLEIRGGRTPSGGEGHAYGARGPLSCEPFGSSPPWHSRLATIVSPREFGPALTSYCTHHRTSNFPTDGANCRVLVFGLSPLQWICREWIQKLGSDEVTTCFGGEKHTESGGPTSQGVGTPHPTTRIPNSSRTPGASFLFLGLLLLLGHLLFSLWDLCCYISFSSIHPPPTLVSHPCLSSSARPIGHSF